MEIISMPYRGTDSILYCATRDGIGLVYNNH